ncbi:MAG: Rieske (2Fe-2S) protein [Balneola sp.]
MDKKNTLTRKDFLKRAGSTALFAALGINFVTGCSSSPTDNNSSGNEGGGGNTGGGSSAITVSGQTTSIDLTHSDVSSLQNSGGWLLITKSSANILVVNIDGSTYRAFSSVCTHTGCTDSWTFSSSEFICNCHGSRFDTQGQVVRGPATSDLPEYGTSVNNDVLTITK